VPPRLSVVELAEPYGNIVIYHDASELEVLSVPTPHVSGCRYCTVCAHATRYDRN